MLTRIGKNLGVADTGSSEGAAQIERDGWLLLRAVFSPSEVEAMVADVESVYDQWPPDVRMRQVDRPEFRYEMYNRSAAIQTAIGNRRILDAVEPLLGNDCHIIANTCWRNPVDFGGGPWHCDAGPHVPRPEGVGWNDQIPYPIFVIGAHLWLRDVRLADGPTGLIPGSHRSGRIPPPERHRDPDLTYDGQGIAIPEADAGDVLLFSSDIWHRGTPASRGGAGRLFIQCHYGRRDIAQRVLTTEHVNHVSEEASARISSDRERDLLGLHRPYFYDG